MIPGIFVHRFFIRDLSDRSSFRAGDQVKTRSAHPTHPFAPEVFPWIVRDHHAGMQSGASWDYLNEHSWTSRRGVDLAFDTRVLFFRVPV